MRVLSGWKSWLPVLLLIACMTPVIAFAQTVVSTAPVAPSGPVWDIVVAVATLLSMVLSQWIKKGSTFLDTVVVGKFPILAVFLPIIFGQLWAETGKIAGWVPSVSNPAGWNPQIVLGGLLAFLTVLWHLLAQSIPWFGRLINAGTTASPASIAPASSATLSKSAP